MDAVVWRRAVHRPKAACDRAHDLGQVVAQGSPAKLRQPFVFRRLHRRVDPSAQPFSLSRTVRNAPEHNRLPFVLAIRRCGPLWRADQLRIHHRRRVPTSRSQRLCGSDPSTRQSGEEWQEQHLVRALRVPVQRRNDRLRCRTEAAGSMHRLIAKYEALPQSRDRLTGPHGRRRALRQNSAMHGVDSTRRANAGYSPRRSGRTPDSAAARCCVIGVSVLRHLPVYVSNGTLKRLCKQLDGHRLCDALERLLMERDNEVSQVWPG